MNTVTTSKQLIFSSIFYCYQVLWFSFIHSIRWKKHCDDWLRQDYCMSNDEEFKPLAVTWTMTSNQLRVILPMINVGYILATSSIALCNTVLPDIQASNATSTLRRSLAQTGPIKYNYQIFGVTVRLWLETPATSPGSRTNIIYCEYQYELERKFGKHVIRNTWA